MVAGCRVMMCGGVSVAGTAAGGEATVGGAITGGAMEWVDEGSVAPPLDAGVPSADK